jgi:hypothetical protein
LGDSERGGEEAVGWDAAVQDLVNQFGGVDLGKTKRENVAVEPVPSAGDASQSNRPDHDDEREDVGLDAPPGDSPPPLSKKQKKNRRNRLKKQLKKQQWQQQRQQKR